MKTFMKTFRETFREGFLEPFGMFMYISENLSTTFLQSKCVNKRDLSANGRIDAGSV